MLQDRDELVFVPADCGCHGAAGAFMGASEAADGVLGIFRDKLLQEDTACSSAPPQHLHLPTLFLRLVWGDAGQQPTVL